jgi:phage baseplate assembly protein W
MGPQGRMQSPLTRDDEILEELKQLVLTDPGERLFLPAFGGGVNRLLFEGADINTAVLAQATLTQAIQKWLAGRVHLNSVSVTANDSTIEVVIVYQIPGSAERIRAVFQRSGA